MTEEERQAEEVLLERPDEHKVGDELYCWMPGNEDRECNGGCVAYDSTYVTDQVRDSCKWLNAFRSMAKSLAMMTQAMQARAKQGELAARKAQAESLPRPPEVR